jgi:hypothetical protein
MYKDGIRTVYHGGNVANHKTLIYKGITMATDAYSTIRASLMGESELMWQKWTDCHDILRLLDRTNLHCSFCIKRCLFCTSDMGNNTKLPPFCGNLPDRGQARVCSDSRWH